MAINIFDYLDRQSIIFGLKQKKKKSVIAAIIEQLVQRKKLSKKESKPALKVILRREEMGSTAIGNRIAFPHARIESIKGVVVCVCIFKEGIDFDSLDEEEVNIVVLLLSNQKETGLHLKMLALFAKMLRDKYLVQRLKNITDANEVLKLLYKQQQAVV